MTNQHVYLDYAAATPMDSRVLAAMQPYFQEKFHNPSAASLPAKAVKQELEAARSTVAQILGARSTEIIFTAGGTEANNLAIIGLLQNYPESHVVTTALEHESVLLPARAMAKKGWSVAEVLPDEKGLVNVDTIAAVVTPQTVLVSVMYANNEIGTIQPIKQIAASLESIRKQRKAEGNETPLYFHTDAAQAVNYLDMHVHRLGVDLMTINGGKIYGPKQSGVLFVRSGVPLMPLLFGGGQESGRRSGTENVAAFIGLAKALEFADAKRAAEVTRLESLRSIAIELLKKEIPSSVINGSLARRLPNNVHLTIPGADNERLLYGLEEGGVICAAGSACSASSEEASHVLLAMGLTDEEARASIRVTFGRDTTEADLKKFVTVLKNLL